MTDKNLSELIVLLDRSGSMASIRDDMIGGFNHLMADRRKDPTRVLVSLYQFNTEYEAVYSARPVTEVPSLELNPRGGTALYDAMVRTIDGVGFRLATLPEDRRPGAVVIMVITDGQENASRINSAERVREKVRHQQEKYNWKFLYLGADASTFLDANTIGIAGHCMGQYTANAQGAQALFSASSNAIGGYYRGVHRGVIGADLSLQGQEQEGLKIGSVTGSSPVK